MPVIEVTAPQPLLAQGIRLMEALQFLGSSLSEVDARQLEALKLTRMDAEVSKQVQKILDPYCIAMVEINPEARVKVLKGPAKALLLKGGWKSFLVKVNNQAGVTAVLGVKSANAGPALHMSSQEPTVKPENIITRGQLDNRFLEIALYRNRPLDTHLTGLVLEYAVVQIYSRESGQREAELGFNIGQGSQDLGFRNSVHILFEISRPVKVIFRVKDDGGLPAMASFLITDGIERILDNRVKDFSFTDYRVTTAQLEYNVPGKSLKGIYPLPSRRVAALDEYPDFFFQPQVYRADGEHVELAPGMYTVKFTRGPEYIQQTKQLIVLPGVDSMEVSFQLKRWINMAALGWYSADHHVHAAGCSHYESPEEGVPPSNMWRQILGEDLNVAAVLAWGPSWYHQKNFFTGKTDTLSTNKNVMRYDVEVSGFPSSHAGHLVLLGLKEDDFPGTKKIEDWPSWTLPVLNWARAQGGLTGYAHSGWGLEPIKPTNELPNYVLPKMDGIGANEYVVTVTQQRVDLYSAGDTPAPWELNMWYHSLNCGFRTTLSGETDFPCIFDERVGIARSYFKPGNMLNFTNYADALKKGRSYVSDGGSHITDITVNGTNSFDVNSEFSLQRQGKIKISAKASAFLTQQQEEAGAAIARRPLNEQPYWNIERARVGTTRMVAVELLLNGMPVDTMEIKADGEWQNVYFTCHVEVSSWIALRIFTSSHTNPVFIMVDKKPIRIKKSADWCRQAVDQCWKTKQSNIREEERPAAAAAYNKARLVYDQISREAPDK
ncbi:MAG: CehA/McbA family metallohydrolase [Chitinophagaceae bacterium]